MALTFALSLRVPIYRDEAISVRAIEIAALPLRYAQGFGSPQ